MALDVPAGVTKTRSGAQPEPESVRSWSRRVDLSFPTAVCLGYETPVPFWHRVSVLPGR